MVLFRDVKLTGFSNPVDFGIAWQLPLIQLHPQNIFSEKSKPNRVLQSASLPVEKTLIFEQTLIEAEFKTAQLLMRGVESHESVVQTLPWSQGTKFVLDPRSGSGAMTDCHLSSPTTFSFCPFIEKWVKCSTRQCTNEPKSSSSGQPGTILHPCLVQRIQLQSAYGNFCTAWMRKQLIPAFFLTAM